MPNTNTTLFTGKSSPYSARTLYPNALYDALFSRIGKKAVIADLGSGTGKFTEPLLRHGFETYAVEPNAEMLDKAAGLSLYPNYHPILAPAEHTTLSSHSIDLMTCAASFHWFDFPAFQTEARRILKPDGLAALIWEVRTPSAPVNLAHAEVLSRFCPAFTSLSHGHDASLSLFPQFFKSYETLSFPVPREMDRETFINRTLSSSYAPKADDEAYLSLIEALSALFEAQQNGRKLTVPAAFMLYIGHIQ